MERREHPPARLAGRYAIFDAIATGGMASVCFGRLVGPKGFARTVVIKRLHPQFVGDADFAAMFLDEARVAARVRHPNVVPVIDVAEGGGEILLVMEYVHGEALAYLARDEKRREAPQIGILVNILAGALHGLHAAHEATGENGKPLGIVHRDVSPQNILVGTDGVARMVDFGVAKAAGQTHTTGVGQVKGKIRYLAPEQVLCGPIDRRSDVWAASVVLWEALAQRRLFSGENDAAVMMEILNKEIPSPRAVAPHVPEAVSAVVMRGLSREMDARFPTALAMAEALEAAVPHVPARVVGEWVARVAAERLASRRRVLDDIEAETLAGPIEGARITAPDPPSSRPVTNLAPTPAPATPTVPPPPLVVPSARRRSPLVAAGAVAIAALSIAAGIGVRSLASGRSARVNEGTVIESQPVVVAEPPVVASTPPPSPPPPPPSTSATASAKRAPAPPPKARGTQGAAPRADFKVPLYGRD